MAKDVSGQPLKFDAADQYEGFANRNETTAPVFECPIDVDYILFESGATGGNYEVTESNNGPTISGIITLGANSQFSLPVGKYVPGVYMENFGTDGQVLVFHGRDS